MGVPLAGLPGCRGPRRCFQPCRVFRVFGGHQNPFRGMTAAVVYRSSRFVFLLAAAFFAAVCTFHLLSAAAGFPFFRAQHLGPALRYAAEGIDFFRPIIPGFNATETPTVLEPAIWQAAAGWTLGVFGGWWGWANVVSLLFFAACLWPLYALAKTHLGKPAAAWAVVAFLAQPVMVYLAGLAGTDGFCVSLSIWYAWAGDRMFRRKTPGSVAVTTLFGLLMATMKLPYFMAVSLMLFLLLLATRRSDAGAWGRLVAVGAVSAAVFLAWTRYTDHCAEIAVFPHVENRVSKPGGPASFYFGDLAYRLSPMTYIKGGWMAMNSLCGSFALAALVLYSLFAIPNRMARAWLGGAVLTTLVFTKLVLTHRHYYGLYAPSVALLMGALLAHIEAPLIGKEAWARWVGRGAAAAGLFLSAAQGLIGMEVAIHYDRHPIEVGRALAEHTSAEDKLLLYPGDWGGEPLIRSGRNGLALKSKAYIEDPESLAELRELGFNRLVLLGDSTLLWAFQVTNPGGAGTPRAHWRDLLDERLAAWPVLYTDERLAILGVPGR